MMVMVRYGNRHAPRERRLASARLARVPVRMSYGSDPAPQLANLPLMAKKPLFRIGAFPRAAAAIAVLSAMDAVIKAMAARYPVFEVAFLRFAFGLVLASGTLLLAPRLAEPRNRHRQWRPGPHRGRDGDDFLLRAQPVAACRDPGADLGAVRRAHARRAARPAHLHGAC